MGTVSFDKINVEYLRNVRSKTLRKASNKKTLSNINERVIRPIALGQAPVAQEVKLEALKLQTEINRKLFELPAKPARPDAPSVAREAEESVLTFSDESLAKAIVEEEEVEEGDTERFTHRPPVDEEAKTQIFTPGESGARTVVRQVTPDEIEAQIAPEPKAAKVLFTSVTKILELTPEEEKVVQDAELTEGAFKSILRKLTDTAEVQSARITALEEEVENLRAEKKALTGQILDELAAKFPSLAKKAKALKAILS